MSASLCYLFVSCLGQKWSQVLEYNTDFSLFKWILPRLQVHLRGPDPQPSLCQLPGCEQHSNMLHGNECVVGAAPLFIKGAGLVPPSPAAAFWSVASLASRKCVPHYTLCNSLLDAQRWIPNVVVVVPAVYCNLHAVPATKTMGTCSILMSDHIRVFPVIMVATGSQGISVMIVG